MTRQPFQSATSRWLRLRRSYRVSFISLGIRHFRTRANGREFGNVMLENDAVAAQQVAFWACWIWHEGANADREFVGMNDGAGDNRAIALLDLDLRTRCLQRFQEGFMSLQRAGNALSRRLWPGAADMQGAARRGKVFAALLRGQSARLFNLLFADFAIRQLRDCIAFKHLEISLMKRMHGLHRTQRL